MTIEFLLELIENNTRVILPEFGAFLIKSDGSGIFKPENITFSPFLRFNDGMLEDALMKHKKIGKDEASKQIVAFVEQIKSSMDSEGAFVLEPFGHLFRDKRGSVHFSSKKEKKKETTQPIESAAVPQEEPKIDEQLLSVADEQPKEVAATTPPEQESSVVEPPIAEPVAPETTPEEDEKLPVAEPVSLPKAENKPKMTAQTKKPAPSTPKPKPEKKQEKSETSAGKAVLIGVIIGVVFIGLAIAGYYLYSQGYFNTKSTKVDKSEILPVDKPEEVKHEEEQPQQTETAPKSELEQEFEKSAPSEKPKQEALKPNIKPPQPTKPQATKEDPKESKPAAAPETSSDGPFHLIAGSFRNAEYASKFSSDLTKSGFDSQVLERENGLFSVTLGSYSTREGANQALALFRSQHPGAWILKH